MGSTQFMISTTMPLFLRVVTRATVIPFKGPSIGPVSEEEDVFAELEDVVSSGVMSSMIGWAIHQGKAVAAPEGRDEIVAIKECLRGTYQGRSLQNWGLLLFFLKKVCIILYPPFFCVHNILV